VAEGRDMGSAVFPEARPKIYLTASLEARTARRASQLRARGEAIDEARIRKDLEDRDLRDESREVSPLRVPGGAVRIDSSEIDLEQQIALVAGFIRGHGHFPGSRLYQWTQRFLRLFFRGLCGVRVRGLERVPAGACVVACNHQAYSDPLLVGSLLPGTAAFMAKAELFRGPLGGLVRRYNAIPVRRGTADRQALRTAVASLRRGVPLVIFPEGTRIRGGALGVPHAGVAWLARRAEVPVLPARVSGGSLLRSALRVEPQQVSFGEPLAAPRGPGRASPDESLPGTDAAFALQVMEAIASLDAPPGGPLPS
jgi:1-acyl-sn-glycerol-3-phosphate acyltransferase